VEDERVRAVDAIESYFKAVESVYGDENGDRRFRDDVWV
jgi:hypothetical protein